MVWLRVLVRVLGFCIVLGFEGSGGGEEARGRGMVGKGGKGKEIGKKNE